MHLEPAETGIDLPPRSTSKPAAARPDVPETSREGLPAAFKMRRERHYVEQLMGDAPLRTVREIPVGDIDPPPAAENAALDELAQSIREVGVLQPLLVVQQGNRFTIVSGGNRYRAARDAGFRTVPCLVHESGSHSVDALREAAARRAAAATKDAAAAAPAGDAEASADEPLEPAASAGLREVTGRLAFVSAVMPSLDAAGYDALRWNTLTDLLKAEMERARSTAAAIEWLAKPVEARRDAVDAAEALEAAIDAVAPEGRLQGVTVHLSSNAAGYELPADRALLVRALTGLLQAMLSLSRRGATLHVDCNGTSVRPALIVSVTQQDTEVDSRAVERFFDAEFSQHPAGVTSALVLAGVAHVARLHGGRVQARPLEGGGCAVTFVIPRPVSAA